MVLAAIAVAALGGCNKAPVVDAAGEPAKAAPTPAAKAVAMKIIDTGFLVSFDKPGVDQLVGQELQRLQMQQRDLTPDQLMAISGGLRKNVQAAVPQMKEAMQAALTDSFTKADLDLLLRLVSSKEGKAINEHMQEVQERTGQVIDAVMSNAADKAVKEMRTAWPVAPPKKPATPDATVPAGPDGNPLNLQPIPAKPADAKQTAPAKPAKPTKPQ
jgi:hypothetical protein